MKNENCFGGFVAVNAGTIENCYSQVKLSVKGNSSGGFVGNNKGTIATSFSNIEKEKLVGGFVGTDAGSIAHSYFFHTISENSKAIKRLADRSLGQPAGDIKSLEDLNSLGFDTETIWQYSQNDKRIRFLDENWMYDISRSPNYEKLNQIKPCYIENAEELRKLANSINEGEPEASSAYIILKADIDLGGKEWIPIGSKRTRAFTGVFDGQGHSITNFVMRDNETKNKGFFGFLKGEVYNLTVDCSIKSNQMAGGIAAYCDGGVIGCCAAIVDISGKNSDFGGLVGVNEGTIFQSYAAGKVHQFAGLWILLPIPFLILLAVLIVMNLPGAPGGDDTQKYAPIPYDPDAVIDPDADDSKPRTDGNFASFQFEQEIDIDLTTGLCVFNFKNPGESNHNIVVQLQFTDSQAEEIMGSTGRTQEEQAELEAREDYDPDNNRTIIAESGAVRPGYMLENLKLVSQPNGAKIPAGSYHAVVYLAFYDINTNNRAMLDSQLPVVINVH